MATTTTMLKTDKTFDEFLKGISFADFDVAYTDGALDSDDMELSDNDVALDATASVVFAGPIKVIEPAQSPTSVDKPTRPMRLPTRKATSPPSGRARSATERRRDRRDRRRNQTQRERENQKRQIKQKDFVERRRECFKREHELRGSICTILNDITRTHHVSVAEAVASLPPAARRVLARSETAVQRYRGFTGQKNLCEQINRLPVWSNEDDDY